MALSNYEITRNQMRGEFVKYDQEKMIRKFSLQHDADYLYISFVNRPNRIHRRTGVVEWSEDGFQTVHEADFNASMTIYDLLCCSKDGCTLSGHFLPVSMLKGTVKTGSVGQGFFQESANGFQGKTKQLKAACMQLGMPLTMSGDVAAILYPFDFLPVTLQFWEADEDFPANLKFMFDENIQDFIHFETTFYLVGHMLSRLRQIADTFSEKTV